MSKYPSIPVTAIIPFSYLPDTPLFISQREVYNDSFACQFRDMRLSDLTPLSVYNMISDNLFGSYRYVHTSENPDNYELKYILNSCEKPFIYKVGSVVLFGTMHIAPFEIFTEHYTTLLMSKSILYIENTIPDSPKEGEASATETAAISTQAKKFIKFYSFASDSVKEVEDTPLFEQLDPKTQNVLSYFLPLDWLTTHHITTYNMAMLATMQINACKRHGENYKILDHELYSLYHNRGHTVHGLETWTHTTNSIDCDLHDLQSITSTCSSWLSPRGMPVSHKLTKTYLSGSLRSTPIDVYEVDDELGDIDQSLLEDRTNLWMGNIFRSINNNEDALIAVGLSHLFGDNGILNYLWQAGHEVNRVIFDLDGNEILEPVFPYPMLAGEVPYCSEAEIYVDI